MLEAFSHVMLFVSDMDRAVGFSITFVAPQAYASLRHEGMGLRLDLHHAEPGDANIGKGPMPYFRVADLDAALATLKALEVSCGEPRREADSPRFASFQDSEGNLLGLEEAR